MFTRGIRFLGLPRTRRGPPDDEKGGSVLAGERNRTDRPWQTGRRVLSPEGKRKMQGGSGDARAATGGESVDAFCTWIALLNNLSLFL